MKFDRTWHSLLRPGDGDDFFSASRQMGAFDPQAEIFDCVNAWWLSEMSRLIYRRGRDEIGDRADPKDRSALLNRAGLKEHRFINCSGARCAVIVPLSADAPPFKILVFRGTNGPENLLSDLKAVQVEWEKGGAVHAGFRDEFFKIRDSAEAELASLPGPLFCTGHSLGGALAILAGSWRAPDGIYTFGAPRVGDAVFAASVRNLPLYRLSIRGDGVTHLPPSKNLYDYCHASEPLWLEPDEIQGRTGSRRPEEREVRHLKQIFDGRHRLTRPPEFLCAHSPVNYSRCLAHRISLSATKRGNCL